MTRLERVLVISRDAPDEFVPVPAEADHFVTWPGALRYDRHTLVRGDGSGYPVFVDQRMTEPEIRIALGMGAVRH